jgi:nucleoside-diphosphate-sugar epimerase
MPLQRILITGGAGFLGSHLAQCFREHGVAVRILDAADAPGWTRTAAVEYLRGDVRDPAAMREALGGVDAIVHSAFASPRMPADTIRSVNVEGVRVACEQARNRGVRRLVLISSTIVQRSPRVHPFLLCSALNAMDLYRESRADAERLAAGMGGADLRVAIVRPKTFVGPGRVSAFTIVFDWIRLGKPVLLLGNATARYQLLEIRDMAEGIRLLALSEAEGVFYFGAGKFGTLREDLQTLIDYARTGSRLRFAPAPLARLGLRAIEFAGLTPPSELHFMSAWGRDSVVDTSRAVKELGWQPRWSNTEALRNAYDWYLESMAATGAAPTIHPLPGSHRRLRNLIDTILR